MTTEAPKPSRTLTVIQRVALNRKEALEKRIKPLQDELKHLDAILATGNPPETGDLFPKE